MFSWNNKYQIIYADPPWAYKDKASAGKRGAEYKYSIPSPDWLRTLPVPLIAAKNCILFLWVTMPLIKDGLNLIERWGFGYKTMGFVWVKKNKIKDSPFWGMGHWTRANAELCLLATKGNPKRISASVHSVVYSPIEKHSKKPNEVKNRIVQLMGDLPRVELFARQKTQGWDVWGDDV